MIKIRSEARFRLDGERSEKGISKQLLVTLGQVWAKINPKGAGYKMVTPSGVAAVRGTEFYSIIQGREKTTIICVEGVVELFNSAGSIMVSAGKTGTAERGKTPLLSDTVDFEEWAERDDTSNSLDIEFEDAQGNKKRLKLQYQD